MGGSFDPAKRDWTLSNKGNGFAEAKQVFAGQIATRADDVTCSLSCGRLAQESNLETVQ